MLANYIKLHKKNQLLLVHWGLCSGFPIEKKQQKQEFNVSIDHMTLCLAK